jgi:hypothetical protein
MILPRSAPVPTGGDGWLGAVVAERAVVVVGAAPASVVVEAGTVVDAWAVEDGMALALIATVEAVVVADPAGCPAGCPVAALCPAPQAEAAKTAMRTAKRRV